MLEDTETTEEADVETTPEGDSEPLPMALYVGPQSPLKAVRANCLQCAGSALEVRLCTVIRCPLHPFRFGKNPFRQKRELSPEQRQAIAERFRPKSKQVGEDE